MRRRDREITNKIAIEEFIAKEQILRIAFYDEGDIYIVPVNYGYLYDEQYTFYFHGAKAGRKYELAKKKPTVGFEIDGNYMLLESEAACDFSATFQKTTISTVNVILHLRLPLQISETSRKSFRILRLNNQNLKTSRNLT